MKIKPLFILLFSLTLFGITSCKKKDGNNTEHNQITKEDKQIISQFSQIGKIHNDGLAQILTDLKAHYGSHYTGGKSLTDKEELFHFINKSNSAFVEATMMPQGINLDAIIQKNSKYDYLISDNFGEPLSAQMQLKNKAISLDNNSSLERSMTPSTENDLSGEFYSGIDKLNNLVDNDAQKEEYDELLESIISNLKNIDEKMKFASAVSVAYHTVQYWSEHLNEWKSFFEGNDRQSFSIARMSQKDDPGKAIGKADITGIITGGVGGCVYGAMGGTVVLPGVGTLAGCAALGAGGAITGGLGNSAKAAVEKFVDWLVG